VPRRRTAWSTTFIQNQSVASAAQFSSNLLNDLLVAGVGVIGGTVLRTHFRISCSSLTTDTNPGFTYGLIVWDKTAAALPNPNTDLNVDWMLESFISPGTAQGPIDQGGSVLYGETRDLRSRRRLHELNDNSFVILVNNGSAAATFGLMVKQLIALP
jgi:hypothetical protein